jgi:hypothetical protein
MKKLMFVFGVAGVVTLSTPSLMNAQTAGKSAAVSLKDDIEAKATRHTERATKELALNDEQKSKFKKFDMDRLYKIQPIQEKIKATSDEKEKENLKLQKKQINDEFIQNVNGILTPAQQEIFKKKIEEIIEKKENHKH